MNYFLSLGVLLVVFSCQSKTTAKEKENPASLKDTTGVHLTLPQTMSDMVARMKAISFSGNNDRDFASLMMEYHDGAIDMARFQLFHGKQKDLKEFSQATITSLKQELFVLSDFLKQEPVYKSSPSKFQQAMEEGISQMNLRNEYNQSDVDHLFALLLIIHHKAGLQMLKAEVEYGAQQAMKTDARNMLAKQLDEIKWLQSWLSKN